MNCRTEKEILSVLGGSIFSRWRGIGAGFQGKRDGQGMCASETSA
jgi:hypothetical protein